ncbi:16966_t:CDS:1 [Dentiscutata erythropus]|uniref:16966_t:CDS:1 n=1 Tax=Dentiscutata erythropus TaxID=1348616 RepID=A0A9N9IDK7_9GLOM|nr:16966_t:CDS:1 [Dentiscutata erythropus]
MYKNAPSSNIRFKHKFMASEVSNTELWKEEYYEEGQDSIITVHKIYGRAIKINYWVGNRNNYISIIPLNRRFNV